MTNDLLQGELVRLVSLDPAKMAEYFSKWSRDSEYLRLLDAGTAVTFSVKSVKEWLEKELLQENPGHWFMIQSLEDERLIGEVGLDGIRWSQGESFVGIGLGDRDSWGKGYGTDAMRTILRYAFRELNLRRISLDVFEYNPRAIRSYEKAGFVYEGRIRQELQRDGRRWDVIYMGILREEWEKREAESEKHYAISTKPKA
jgi:RimJ/RimL family protein N-acetyltransferase